MLTYKHLFKLALFGLCVFFVYAKLKDTNLSELWSNLKSQTFFWSVALLFGFNYLFEVLKWRAIVQGLVQYDNRKLIRGVLTGQALGLFAPLLSGEYTGRVLHLQDQNRHKVLGSYLASVFIQSLMAVSLGTFSSLVLGIRLGWWGLSTAWALALAYSCIVVLCLYGFRYSKKWTKYIPEKRRHIFESYRLFDKKRLFWLVFYFFLRYAVICFQFFLSFRAFGLEISLVLTFLAISTVLSAKNFFAGVGTVVELGVRQVTLAYVMELLGYNVALATLAGFWVWLVNIGLASVLGSWWIWKTKL
jgi:MFS family permease